MRGTGLPLERQGHVGRQHPVDTQPSCHSKSQEVWTPGSTRISLPSLPGDVRPRNACTSRRATTSSGMGRAFLGKSVAESWVSKPGPGRTAFPSRKCLTRLAAWGRRSNKWTRARCRANIAYSDSKGNAAGGLFCPGPPKKRPPSSPGGYYPLGCLSVLRQWP